MQQKPRRDDFGLTGARITNTLFKRFEEISDPQVEQRIMAADAVASNFFKTKRDGLWP